MELGNRIVALLTALREIQAPVRSLVLQVGRQLIDVGGCKLSTGAFEKWGAVGSHGIAAQLQ